VNGTLEATGGGHPAGWADKAQHGYEVNRTGLAGCKSCHGTDLTGGSSGVSCTTCHTTAGFASWATSCTFCHGNRTTGRQSPPVDTQGRTASSNVSVGAHDAHVGSAVSSAIACTECHASRGDVITDAAHVDGNGTAEVVFGALARTGGKAPVYTRASATSATCASTYCHGAFTGGVSSGVGATVSWTSTTAATCTSCHGSPPSTGKHSKHVGGEGVACYVCHNAVVTASNAIADATLHVNGAKDVRLGGTWSGNSITGTWTAGARTCSNLSCHGSKSW
jgi:predicted CxxxxCH...CXXCH cytochrome family protein